MLNYFRRALILLFVALLGSTSLPAMAWGPKGHEIVAKIAELRLTPSAAKAVHDLLNGTDAPGGSIRLSDDDVANWADDVRPRRAETGPWHYVDIPFRAVGYDAQRDCAAHKGCVVEAIRDNARLLGDPEATETERRDALRFLVHFVADIHQPLHCAERNGDKGGNLCMVLYPGKSEPVKLHVVWDIYLVDRALDDQQLPLLVYAEVLNSRITSKRADSWSKGTSEDWAWESHAEAINDTYWSIPENGPPHLLAPEYLTCNVGVVQEQLMKAGVRLASILNEILK